MEVSVVIPSFNYGRFIRTAIESVLDQTVKPLEIIVVDDGSTDDTEVIVRSFGESVKYIKQINSGVGVARNRGVAESSGDYIAFLDADDFWHPQKLEKQLAVFETDQEIGLVHCGLYYVNNDGKITDKLTDGREGWVDKELLVIEPVIVGPGSTSLIKRSVYEQVGGFDIDPALHPVEDWEFSYRTAKIARFGFVSDPLLYYRQHGKGGHTNIRRMERAMLIGFEKAFSTKEKDVLVLKYTAYGKLNSIVSGSYFRAGQYVDCLRTAIKSIYYNPRNLSVYSNFLRRNFFKKTDSFTS